MPRPSNTNERRTEIARGLQRVMAEHGYERASVAAIARAAGLTPGLVHYHFENKRAILLELTRQLASALSARAASYADSEAPPRDRLFAVVDAWLAADETADRTAVACWVDIGTEATRNPEVSEIYSAFVGEAQASLAGLIRQTLKAEGRRESGSARIALALFAAIEGFFRVGLAAPSQVAHGIAAPTVRAIASSLLDAQPEGSRRS